MRIEVGIPERDRRAAAQLYDVAFGSKLALAVPDSDQRLVLLTQSLFLDYAVAAFDDQKLVGLAGFSTSEGSLTGGIDYRSLLRELGFIGGHRAALVFSVYEREIKPTELLMDGVVVDAPCRGRGIGTQLFARIMDVAREGGYATIRLDVIDTNPAAKRLYQRLGFVEGKTESFEFLRGVLGFGASTTMIYTL
ncbi:MAG: GNAT family N-acetyltransferase [Gammaproteobacteria bacterium]